MSVIGCWQKERHSEEARKASERAKGASKEAMRRKNAELEAVRRQMKHAQAENKSLEVDRKCSTERASASGAGVPDDAHTRRTPENRSRT